ncbi:MAG: aminotransferase class V-fold PLP-dependent enzyme [Erysipelotrichaceae bacterium]|nr:aminotransferase class V-fold PLP-dependent enzyme [Erysipelotrichaceae bacterium]MBQ5804707.1 aminotransferase class V-fold PLP-dependent enzyme [Erysipelotrichaceae bacterium]
MKTYPLQSISLEEATQKQFRMVSCITHHFTGYEQLSRGDLGVHQPENQPLTTKKAEEAIAEFFSSEAAIMVRGSGTGAIRYALSAVAKAKDKILIHDAPVYSTTKISFEMLGSETVRANFNDIEDTRKVMRENADIKAVLIQHSRQLLEDSYDLKKVIDTIKKERDIPIVIDENYAVMKVDRIGCEMGADLSCFSTFKLQGPEGIGVVVGKKEYIDRIRKMHYSGGCQTQGHEAMDVLRGLVTAPVLLAVQAQTNEEVLRRLQNGEVEEIKDVCIANSQSKVLVVEFRKDIAEAVLKNAEQLGALPNPVGAESKYELAPMFYRASGTVREKDPDIVKRLIRINPNRAGADTVIEILRESVKRSL